MFVVTVAAVARAFRLRWHRRLCQQQASKRDRKRNSWQPLELVQMPNHGSLPGARPEGAWAQTPVDELVGWPHNVHQQMRFLS